MDEHWYILSVIPGRERSIAEKFSQRADVAIKTMIPLSLIEGKNGKFRPVPTYVGYVFVGLDDLIEIPSRLVDILTRTEGVYGFVGGNPQELPSVEVEAMKRSIAVNEDTPTRLSRSVNFSHGEPVSIREGSFEGRIGRFIDYADDRQSVSVEIDGMGGRVTVKIPLRSCAKVS